MAQSDHERTSHTSTIAASATSRIESSKVIQSERAAKWLEAVGVNIPRKQDGSVDATIEISTLTAVCSDDLRSIELPESIAAIHLHR